MPSDADKLIFDSDIKQESKSRENYFLKRLQRKVEKKITRLKRLFK